MTIEEIIKKTKQISNKINDPNELNIFILILLKNLQKKKIISSDDSLLQQLQVMYPYIK